MEDLLCVPAHLPVDPHGERDLILRHAERAMFDANVQDVHIAIRGQA
jgi:hypothetical protein